MNDNIRSLSTRFSDDSLPYRPADVEVQDDQTVNAWHLVSRDSVEQDVPSIINTDEKLAFSLWAQTFHDTEDHLLCRRASFSASWLDLHSHKSPRTPLFNFCDDTKGDASTAGSTIYYDYRLTNSHFRENTLLDYY